MRAASAGYINRLCEVPTKHPRAASRRLGGKIRGKSMLTASAGLFAQLPSRLGALGTVPFFEIHMADASAWFFAFPINMRAIIVAGWMGL